MQHKKPVRSNKERTEATRAALIAAARALFVDKGYAETGTPEIVARARVTRGALYHHFPDKAALFRAVIEAEMTEIAEAINQRTDGMSDPLKALQTGSDAYFEAMTTPGRARLVLLEGPMVLGVREIERIDRQTGGQTLLDGLEEAKRQGLIRNEIPLEPLADLLSAAFDRAALAIAEGAPPAPYRATIDALLSGLSKAPGAS
ncbi:MAG: TetR/AcrR family transcriptional regulator [Sneathiella sp.]